MSTKIVYFNGRAYTLEELGGMDPDALVTLYNQIAANLDEAEVHSFASKEAAVENVWELLGQLPEGLNTDLRSKAEPKPRRARAPKEPGEPRVRAARAKRFQLPVAESVREPQEGTLRALVVNRLDAPEPTKFEDVVEAVKQFDKQRGVPEKNVERRAYEVLRLLHTTMGFGLSQTDDGVISLVRPEK